MNCPYDEPSAANPVGIGVFDAGLTAKLAGLEELPAALAAVQTKLAALETKAPAIPADLTAKLAALCSAAVVVLASERTPKAGAMRTKQILDEHKVRILGSVINRARRTSLLGHGSTDH